MDNQSGSPLSLPSDRFILIIKSIAVGSKLPKLKAFSNLKPYAVVTLSSYQTCTTSVLNTRKPKWEEDLEFDVRKTSSLFRIRIVHHADHINHPLICSYSGSVKDLVSGTSHNLIKDGAVVGQLSVQISLKDIIFSIPPHNEREFFKSIHPLTEALASLAHVASTLVYNSQVYNTCKAAWQSLSSLYTMLLNRRLCDPNVEKLSVSLRYTLTFAADSCPWERIEGRMDVVEDICVAIQDAATAIQEYDSLVSDAKASEASLKEIRMREARLFYLYKRFNHAFEIQTWARTGTIYEDPSRHERDYVETLAAAHDLHAGYESVDSCSPGTRATIINDLITSLRDTSTDRSKILWLHGPPGSGKSAIAATVCRLLDESGHLASSFFVSHVAEMARNSHSAFSTLASGLSQIPFVGHIIWSAIKKNPRLQEFDASAQFSELIAHPLTAVDPLDHPTVIVIDGLDELPQSHTVLSVITSEVDHLPKFIKILITSRSKERIQTVIDGMGAVVHRLTLDHDRNIEDIRAFISRQTQVIAHKFGLDPDWPGDVSRQALAQKSGSSFVWASTAMMFVEDEHANNPNAQLQLLLRLYASGRNEPSDLDNLYALVLRSALPSKHKIHKVLGAVVIAQYPMSLKALGNLLGLDAMPGNMTIIELVQHLKPVLFAAGTELVLVRHRSFVDFLTRPTVRAGRNFLVNTTEQHHILALDPSLLLLEEHDLRGQISKNISETLIYACHSWAWHVSHATLDNNLLSLVRVFYSKSFLMWLEVLSVLGDIQSGHHLLRMVGDWLKRSNDTDNDLLHLATECGNFLAEFEEPISMSPMDTYYSALPFFAKDSLLYRTYSIPLKGQIPTVTSVSFPTQPAAELRTIGTPADVTTVVFSPNGQRAISGSQDGSIHMWHTVSGSLIGGVLLCHTDAVTSIAFSVDGVQFASGSNDGNVWLWDGVTGSSLVRFPHYHTSIITTLAFSPDGTHVISGSDDKTVRLWGGVTGASIGGALSGHSDWVYSVAFSPDGRCIVSSSWDKTLRLWDGVTGAPIGGALTGHSRLVRSVAFSPDGIRIISGSDDNTLRLWDGVAGIPIGHALTGHSDSVRSAAFSPDGKHIVSGSNDNTLRLWDGVTGAPIGGALRGHFSCVLSVAFSPDGKRIVSGSQDTTLRLWDRVTGAPIGRALAGHSGYVVSVAFSPDGKRIVSGSADETLRLWDGVTGAPIGDALAGHSDWVRSVAFSPDGTRIVSASGDKTLRLWDGVTGTPIGGALTGHSSLINSVAFSPDGTRIVSGSADETLRLWDGVTGAPRRALGSQSGPISRVTFSSDGKSVRSESKSQEVHHWDIKSFRPVLPQTEDFTLPPALQLSEKSGWLTIDGERILWVPKRYRENAVCAYSEHGYVAIGNKSGLVIINGTMLGW